jgi:hypothetical protein
MADMIRFPSSLFRDLVQLRAFDEQVRITVEELDVLQTRKESD